MGTKTCRFGIFRIQPRAPPPAGGFSKFFFVADKLIFKISYSGRKIPTLTTSPPFPLFIGRKLKGRRSGLVLFRIQPRAPPPAGVVSKFIFVADNLQPSNNNNDNNMLLFSLKYGACFFPLSRYFSVERLQIKSQVITKYYAK